MNWFSPPSSRDQLGSGRQKQVEGVAEDHLVAERGDLARLERLDRAARRERHKCRRRDVAMREVQSAGRAAIACIGSGP